MVDRRFVLVQLLHVVIEPEPARCIVWVEPVRQRWHLNSHYLMGGIISHEPDQHTALATRLAVPTLPCTRLVLWARLAGMALLFRRGDVRCMTTNRVADRATTTHALTGFVVRIRNV